MPLSIKDPEADRLARAIAQATGSTLTDAVLSSLRERLARLERQRQDHALVMEDVMEIARHCASLPLRDRRSEDEILGYDPSGIPGA